ncbi:IclR family transcriptional regulator [Sphingosinicella soli]|uniref:DNA-binding IclR family transcriptional regulator n=1 Tax=Sphingosinicella soli TaxID=333708 RepID=A0A7W7AZ64_9SPHN|nr:helix-turn-helix domain-containing protein [Sphingosinicella soli]MBB4631061.1 DNA-binding IclR family transcriptional regulator [Sphingosinicella soli]
MSETQETDDDIGSARVKSVEVTVQILEVLTEATDTVRVTDMARQLGMTKARVSRHLQTLTRLGLVDRAREGEGYVFGRKLLKFGRAAVYRSNIVQLARPFLQDLFTVTGHTALLATPTRGGAMVVSSVNNQFEPGIMIHSGMVLTLPTSPAARLIYFFENQKPTPPRVAANLKRYGVDFEANPRGTGLGGVAAPIFEPDGLIAGTIGLILSSSLLMPEPDEELLAQVRFAAQRLQKEYAEGAVSPLMPKVED